MLASRHHTHRITVVLFSTGTVLCLQALVALPAQAPAVEAFTTAQPQPADGETNQARRQRLIREERRRRFLNEPGGVPKPTVVLAPGEVPQIEFETSTFSIGRVMAGKVVRHDYWFKNVGTGPLEILRVKPSCNCTSAGEYDRIVQPGGRGKISIAIDTSRLGGEVIKSVTVNTNMISDPRVVLNITGQVWRPIEATPTKASFDRISKDALKTQPTTRKLILVNNMKSPASLTNVRSGSPAFSATLKVLEVGKKFELIVSGHLPVEPGMNYTTIKIDTSLPEMPVLSIPVSMYVTAAVIVSPAKLALRQNRPRDVRRSFFITNSTTTPMTISDIQVSNPLLKATLETTRPGSAYRLLLKIPAEYKVSPGGDTITMKTSHPYAPTLTIPIVVRTTATR